MDSLTVLVIWVGAALICVGIADLKGRNVASAFGLGLLFGVFAILYYWLSPGSDEYEKNKAKQKIRRLS